MFESLESRRLMAAGVTVTVSGNTMTITGGSKGENISVHENAGNVNVFDQVTGTSYFASGITNINVKGSGKNDRVDYTGNTVGAVMQMAGGDDSVSIDDEGTGS